MNQRHPDHNIPLAERIFAKHRPVQHLLVIQYVTEIGTNKTYFRFMSPAAQIEGYAGTADEAYERALDLSAKLGLEIHDEIMYVTV